MELLRDRRAEFDEVGVQPVGISRDSPYTHIAWTQALDLNFGLLSDFNGEAVRAFGIGFEFRGFHDVAQRSAFLVDERGVIRNAWNYETGDVPDVDVWLEAARALNQAARPASIDGWTHQQRGQQHQAAARTTSRTRSSPPSSSSA
jgi:peroxiredoxin